MIYGRLYARSLGVHIGPHQVRAVEMVRLGPWVRCRRTWCLPAGDDPAEALEQLAARARPATLRVAGHLDPVHLRTEVREVAAEDLGRPDWPERLATALRPPATPPDAFAPACRLFVADEERAIVGTAVASARALEARVELLRGAGLDPAFIGVPAFEVASAGAFDHTFMASCRALVIEGDDDLQVARLRGGTLTSLHAAASPDLRDAVAEAAVAAGDSAAVWLAAAGPAAGGPTDGAILVVPLRGLRGAPLEPAFATAAGLAVRALYLQPGQPGDGSFLDAAPAAALQDRHEQALGRRLTLSMGAIVLAALLALAGAEMLYESRLARAQEALAPVAGLLATLEEEQRLTARLRAEVHAAEERVGARSQAAAALAAAAALSPEGVRWRELGLRLGEEEGPLLVLDGLARADTSLAVLLRALEASALTTEVQLVMAETVTPGAGAERALPPGPPLRRFVVHANLQRAVAGTAARRPET